MKRPSFQFYPGDWLSNKNLRRCTHHERGVWMDVMCLMHDNDEEYGILRWPLQDIAEAVKCSMDDLLALVRKGVMKGSQPNLAFGASFGVTLGSTEGSPPNANQATKGAASNSIVRVEYIFTPTHAGKKGEPVTLIPEQEGPIWYSSRMVLDEYVRNRRGSFGINGLESPNHPQNTGAYQHGKQPMPTLGDTNGASIGEQPKVGIGATKGATKGATPSSSSSSSSSHSYLNPLVSFGDLSKPEVSTGAVLVDDHIKSETSQAAQATGVIDVFAMEPENSEQGEDSGEIACPHQEIIDLYHEMLPTLSRIRKSSWSKGQSAVDLRTRWREGLEDGHRDGVNIEKFAFQTREQGLEAFAAFFRIVQQSPLLLGEVPGKDGSKGFMADLRWLIKRSNFEKTIQGNYLSRGESRNPQAFSADRPASRLGLKPGEVYDRFADFGSRSENEDPRPSDKRLIVFDGGIYLFGEDIVLMDATDDDLVAETIREYAEFGQIARVPVEKLPKKVRIMMRARLGGLVNDAPDDMTIDPDELPVFGAWEETV